MRGDDQPQAALFSYVSIEDRIPADHPLRTIQTLANPILTALSPRFQTMYSTMGRPSTPPERLLRALLLQILFTIRSERRLMEQLNYNLLFRWFVGLNQMSARSTSGGRGRAARSRLSPLRRRACAGA
jgi:transposase